MTTSSRLRHRLTIAATVTAVAVVVAAAVVIPLSLSSGSARSLPAIRPARGLHVMPFPGTLAASPQTQIIFSSVRPREIRSVSVVGSTSGPHGGRMTVLPLHRGTAFIPTTRFADGEQVTVQARLGSPAAGTALGAPNSTHIKFDFVVGAQVNGNVGPSSANVANTTTTTTKPPPGQTLNSVPSLHPPKVKASGSNPDPSAGKIFVTPNNGQQVGPMILGSRGQLVWFRPLRTGQEASNLAVQRYHGKPVLTWWQGVVVAGHGVGEDVVLDQHYHTVAVVHAGEGFSTDLHEFKITPQGTAFVTSFNAVKANLTSVGGKAQGESVFDAVIQEIYIPTGQVLWEWHSLGHVPISDSYMGTPTPGQPYDYFHLNTIQQLPNGNLLITARNTWGV
ncbi:MAG TPA: arylsulfotransferase family protein, partial [Solirubrobacteraceae bacterium]|nr:arylsulfotransferase family protein [Solirubrobacteraceae bacterium]